jgi:hypothetical protein
VPAENAISIRLIPAFGSAGKRRTDQTKRGANIAPLFFVHGSNPGNVRSNRKAQTPTMNEKIWRVSGANRGCLPRLSINSRTGATNAR